MVEVEETECKSSEKSEKRVHYESNEEDLDANENSTKVREGN